MYNRLDTIPDRQTSCDGVVRAMHTRRAVKTKISLTLIQLASVVGNLADSRRRKIYDASIKIMFLSVVNATSRRRRGLTTTPTHAGLKRLMNSHVLGKLTRGPEITHVAHATSPGANIRRRCKKPQAPHSIFYTLTEHTRHSRSVQLQMSTACRSTNL